MLEKAEGTIERHNQQRYRTKTNKMENTTQKHNTDKEEGLHHKAGNEPRCSRRVSSFAFL